MIDVSKAAFVHPSALFYGDVSLGTGASVWPHAVARAEMHHITIGDYTNIQDFVMLHVGYGTPTVIGAYCSITHHVTLHGCTIGDNCLIGIGATVMDGAVIGENSIVGEHALVRPGVVIPPNSMWRASRPRSSAARITAPPTARTPCSIMRTRSAMRAGIIASGPIRLARRGWRPSSRRRIRSACEGYGPGAWVQHRDRFNLSRNDVPTPICQQKPGAPGPA